MKIIRNTRLWSILTGVFSFLLCILLVGTHFADSYASMINKELGISTSVVIKNEDTDEDTEYYKSNFDSDDELTQWQIALCEQIQGEGSVLVMNNGALPVAKGIGVTTFGRSSADIIYGGTGSGQVDTANAATMGKALTEAGFKVNQPMLDWYNERIQELKDAGMNRSTPGMFAEFDAVPGLTRIAEIPTDTVRNSGISYDGYDDLAIVTIGRSGGEGSDLAFGEFSDGYAYFELQEEEKELLKYVASLNFDTTVVLINSSNAMALDWIDDPAYGIDACLWIGGPGQYGMNSVAKILCGDINPSGKFVDTYAASSLSSPAMQNFGAYTYANAAPETGTVGGVTIDGARISGWYGPAMNIHRTPYSGRNFEYYSEDGFLSGVMAAKEVAAAQSMGLCCYIKHFALNDFETYRQSVATFATEQAIREIFLKGFQYAVEDGGATAVMTSFNRIGCRWAGAHRELLQNVLRDEWGFVGVVHTDAVMANRNWMDVSIGVEAGNDTWLSSGDWLVPLIQEWAQEDNKLLANLRNSCHNFLYAYVNSTAVNGISSSDRVVTITPAWQICVYAADAVVGVLAAAGAVLFIIACIKNRKGAQA